MTYKHLYRPTKGRGWAVVNARRHAERIANPTRKELSLRDAVKRCGYLDAEWNVEELMEGDIIVNFICKFTLRGKPAYIWFADSRYTPGNPYNVKARDRKIQFVQTHDCYALELWDNTADILEAGIEMWMIGLNRTPIKLASKRRPGRPPQRGDTRRSSVKKPREQGI
jgi:hypothetical protein